MPSRNKTWLVHINDHFLDVVKAYRSDNSEVNHSETIYTEFDAEDCRMEFYRKWNHGKNYTKFKESGAFIHWESLDPCMKEDFENALTHYIGQPVIKTEYRKIAFRGLHDRYYDVSIYQQPVFPKDVVILESPIMTLDKSDGVLSAEDISDIPKYYDIQLALHGYPMPQAKT